MDQSKREYDRFGPWIVEISDADPPPPLFEPHLSKSELPVLGIKIPRPIERRAARPGMDLYDYVVYLYEDDGLILHRLGNEVLSTEFAYRDVQHLHMSVELLLGEVRLGLPDQTYKLPFNAVSSELIGRLVDVIRERYGRNPAPPPASGPGPDPRAFSHYFAGLLASEAAADSNMRLLAAQTEISIEADEVSIPRRILYGLVRKRLLESLHLSDGRELKIISRATPFALGWQRVYGSATWYIPTTNLIDVTWREDERNSALTACTLRTRGSEHSFVFGRDNASIEAYSEYLSGLLSPGHAAADRRDRGDSVLGVPA